MGITSLSMLNEVPSYWTEQLVRIAPSKMQTMYLIFMVVYFFRIFHKLSKIFHKLSKPTIRPTTRPLIRSEYSIFSCNDVTTPSIGVMVPIALW